MVQSLNRAMEIVRLVAESESGLRLYELSEMTGLKKTTVFNLASTLIQERMLEKGDDSKYHLGRAIDELYLTQNKGIKQRVLEKSMIQLKKKYITASISYVELVESELFIKTYIHYGKEDSIQYPKSMKINPYLTTAGLVFFAYMNGDSLQELKASAPFEFKGLEWWKNEERFQQAIKRTLEKGYSESEMTPDNVLKYAAPVFGTGGGLTGAITLTLPDKREWEDISTQIIKDLLDTTSICS